MSRVNYAGCRVRTAHHAKSSNHRANDKLEKTAAIQGGANESFGVGKRNAAMDSKRSFALCLLSIAALFLRNKRFGLIATT
jgi:hypothetical protein